MKKIINEFIRQVNSFPFSSPIRIRFEDPIDQEFKLKLQELHLYQTVLTQGIHNLKSSVDDRAVVDLKVKKQIFSSFVSFDERTKDLDQSRMMLGVTCDAFIQTLDECVKLANGTRSTSTNLTMKTRRSRSSSSSNERFSSNFNKNLSEEKQFRTFFSDRTSR